MARSIPTKAEVVIIGGGVMGTSLAYHLTKIGINDVVLLDRKTLTSGTTWHAAGLVGQLRATKNLTNLAQYTTELYEQLETETGQATGYLQRGSVSVATNDGRMEELKRTAAMAKSYGLEVHTLVNEQIKELWPLVNTDDLVGGVHLPNDGSTNPIDTTQAMAKGARAGGAKIIENCKVTKILTDGEKATGVVTDEGTIEAKYVALCTGMWSRDIGKSVGVTIPLHACQHFYIVTEPMEGMYRDLPVLRDPDGCAYYKEDTGKLMLGAFEGNAKSWDVHPIPEDFEFTSLSEDWDHFEPVMMAALNRVPALEQAGIQLFFNGPESFTPDVRYYLGEAPELNNFFVGTGFNSIGIQSAGGAGKVLADWIKDGHPPIDLWDVDIRRVMPFQKNKEYTRVRAEESLGLLYADHFPFRQAETGRGVRRSPIHHLLAEEGACFGEVAGYERPNWFAPEGVEPKYDYSWGRQNWFEYSAEEHRNVRENVGLFDLSSFAAFLVQGRDAEEVLNKISANDMAVAPGKIVYTQWCNERGGIEADLTVTRLSETEFMVVTAGAGQTRDMAWLRKHTPADAHCFATDVSSGTAIFGLMGPKSRELLQPLVDVSLSNEDFPFGTSQEIDLGFARVRASRITYVGELGWELYVPTEFAVGVYEVLRDAGQAFGLKPAGMHALNSLRMEKGFRHFGDDIAEEDTPYEAGLGFAVKLGKNGGFIGRDALVEKKAEGVLKRRMVQIKLKDSGPMLYHDEPVYRNGVQVGETTSAMYGHMLDGSVALVYISNEEGVTLDYLNSGKFEVDVAGELFEAEVSLKPMWDPKSERVKA